MSDFVELRQALSLAEQHAQSECWKGHPLAVILQALIEKTRASLPDIRYEFSVFDDNYVEQACGSAPTFAQALSEGQRYLAQYLQDGTHTLELRRVELLPIPQEVV